MGVKNRSLFTKVRIEFEEVAGYPQLVTIRLWVNKKEVTDGLKKGTLLSEYMRNMS